MVQVLELCVQQDGPSEQRLLNQLLTTTLFFKSYG